MIPRVGLPHTSTLESNLTEQPNDVAPQNGEIISEIFRNTINPENTPKPSENELPLETKPSDHEYEAMISELNDCNQSNQALLERLTGSKPPQIDSNLSRSEKIALLKSCNESNKAIIERLSKTKTSENDITSSKSEKTATPESTTQDNKDLSQSLSYEPTDNPKPILFSKKNYFQKILWSSIGASTGGCLFTLVGSLFGPLGGLIGFIAGVVIGASVGFISRTYAIRK